MSEAIIKLKKLHQGQLSILAGSKRFNVIKCGRRFGKTELSVDLVVEYLLEGKTVGYFTPTYKDLAEVWLLIRSTIFDIIKSKDESLKQIILLTGGKLDMWSMEDPNSGRGRKYHRVIIDEAEKARHFKEAWEQTIRATLVDYKGDAWFFSTPKFGQTYFKEIALNDEKFEDWASFKFTTYDNPFIDKSEIDQARAQLDELTFRCEFMADDVDLTMNPFCYAFDEGKHVKPVEYDPMEPLCISFDFNKDPLTAVAWQNPEAGTMRAIKEYRLMNGDIESLCDMIIVDWKDAIFMVTGDATGQARSALVKGNYNYYTVIKQRLGIMPSQIKTPSVNPSIRNTRVLLNSLMQNGKVEIDPSCTFLIKDLKYSQVDDEGDLIKDRRDGSREADFLDNARYTAWTFHQHWLKYL